MVNVPQDTRHVRLVTEKTVEHFLQSLFAKSANFEQEVEKLTGEAGDE